MANQQPNKFYPAASEEIAKMLGLTGEAPVAAPKPVETTPEVPTAEAAPVELPVQPTPQQTAEEILANDVVAITGKKPAYVEPPKELQRLGTQKSWGRIVGKTLLALIPYVLVFAVGVFAYYAWFADPSNRPSVFKSFQKKTPSASEQKAKAFAELKKDERANYNAWIAGYYYNVTDSSIVDMDHVSPNKLTNFENYLLKLNPKTNDVRGTGVADADLVLQGVDPVTGGPLKDEQRDIVAQYFDTEAIRTRTPGVAVSTRAITPRVAQAETTAPSYAPPTQTPPPAVVTPTPSPVPAAPAPNVNDCAENKLKINTNIPGRLEVPSMGVNVPIIWTRDAKNFDKDLESGVVHYPCTPLPGDLGTSYISGHSSNYAWVKADYNKVFARMNELVDGATFKVTVVGQDGKDIRLYYVVQRKTVYDANDQAQFTNTAESLVALSTCWPLNTTKQRMVAYGKLDRVER